ncbi:MAG TPA: hypothetical protein O0X63_04705, partial [Methanocorpusculum sp.]|nr:hypothetical protein [Methanocorpusculum sp.]
QYYYTPTVTRGDTVTPLPLLTPLVSLFDLQVDGIMERTYIYDIVFLEDGTLLDVIFGDILERVSPA